MTATLSRPTDSAPATPASSGLARDPQWVARSMAEWLLPIGSAPR